MVRVTGQCVTGRDIVWQEFVNMYHIMWYIFTNSVTFGATGIQTHDLSHNVTTCHTLPGDSNHSTIPAVCVCANFTAKNYKLLWIFVRSALGTVNNDSKEQLLRPKISFEILVSTLWALSFQSSLLQDGWPVVLALMASMYVCVCVFILRAAIAHVISETGLLCII